MHTFARSSTALPRRASSSGGAARVTLRAAALRLAFAVCLTAALAGCDDDPSLSTAAPIGGTITLAADQGVTFADGALIDPGNWGNSDVYATSNGDAMRLAAGGPSPTTGYPAVWFKTSGGVFETYDSLADVPATKPTGTNDPALLKAKPGNGFMVQTADGAFVKGWLQAADAAGVTIVYTFVP